MPLRSICSTLFLAALSLTMLVGTRPAQAQSPDPPEATALIRAATERIGGDAWSKAKSVESIAVASTAMGEARIEFRSVAPNARHLMQTMPGGRGVMEMGVVDGVAWMGEPGRARAIDPKLAQEMSGGGDLQSLVHALDTRFTGFELAGKVALDGRDAWKITMQPREAGPTGLARWTAFIDVADLTILGLEIPAPPKDLAPNAGEQFAQTIRFRDWIAAETPTPKTDAPTSTPAADGAEAAKPARRVLAFKTAVIEAGGMETELTFTRVALDTLAADAIRVPESIEPMAAPRRY